MNLYCWTWKQSINQTYVILIQDRTHITPYYQANNMHYKTQNLYLKIKWYKTTENLTLLKIKS